MLTSAEAFPLEIFSPVVGIVNLAGFPALGVGKQVRVRLGALLLTGQEVKVLQARTLVGFVSVSLGGRRQRRRAGKLSVGGRDGEPLAAAVYQVGPGRQRRTPVVIVLHGAGGRQGATAA